MDLTTIRGKYTTKNFDIKDLNKNPFKQFEVWFNDALNENLLEPNAFSLATVGSDMMPSIRTVLLKYFDPVWNFYVYKLKYHLFLQKEQLFLHLLGLPESINYDEPLPYYLANEEIFRFNLNTIYRITFGFSPSELAQASLSSNDIEYAYKDLKSYLEKTPLNTPEYLKSVADKFRTILNLIPGEIY